MRLSGDGESWSAWEPFSTTREYTLPAGEGARTAHVQFQDAAGNVSATVTASIIVDMTAPAEPLPTYINFRTIDLSWTAGDGDGSGVEGVEPYYSTDGGATWTQYWQAVLTEPVSFNVGADGSFAFSARAVDKAGLGKPVPDGPEDVEATTILDTTPPTGTITINDGAEFTGGGEVTLSLTASPDTVAMQFNTGGSQWSEWELYAAARAWSFDGGSGGRVIYVQFKDAAGHVTPVTEAIYDTITLDLISPPIRAGQINWDQTSRTFEIPWVNEDWRPEESSPVASVKLYYSTHNGGTTWFDWAAYASTRDYTLSQGEDGTRTVYAQFREGRGNESAAVSDSIDNGDNTYTATFSAGLAGQTVRIAVLGTDLAGNQGGGTLTQTLVDVDQDSEVDASTVRLTIPAGTLETAQVTVKSVLADNLSALLNSTEGEAVQGATDVTATLNPGGSITVTFLI